MKTTLVARDGFRGDNIGHDPPQFKKEKEN
jgi:hypothetical protein